MASNTVRDAHRPGPTSLPSPTTSAERTSEEERLYPRPIIQNVAAKRDTLTYHPPRRQSFAMDIDEDQSSLNFGAQRPPPRSALRPSPPELKNLPLFPTQASTHTPPRSPAVSSSGLQPPRPRQVPYEGPLRSPARAPDDWVNARERMGSDARERPTFEPNFEPRERVNSDTRERSMERRDIQDSDTRRLASPEAILPRIDRTPQLKGYIGLPTASRRVAPGEGERSYGITPANRRQPPPPVDLQRKASNPRNRQAGWDDLDVQHENFALVSPRIQTPQPPTPNSLVADPSGDANWPLPSPLASPTFGSGNRPYTPSEKSEGQMSPGCSLPSGPARDQGRDYRRPDFGLRAPTGIADEFRIGFI